MPNGTNARERLQMQTPNGAAQRSVHLVNLPKFSGQTAIVWSTDGTLGTIKAKRRLADTQSYCQASEYLVQGTPLPLQTGSPSATGRTLSNLRAKDLIAELDAINAQVNRMMFQV